MLDSLRIALNATVNVEIPSAFDFIKLSIPLYLTIYVNLSMISYTTTYWATLDTNTRPQGASPAHVLLETFLRG